MAASQYRSPAIPPRQQAYNAPVFSAPAAAPAAPAGTFQPGTKVQVGKHRVIIEKYLSEGGFAHVYLVRVPRPDGTISSSPKEIAVLKRVAVPDKEALANMRTEVETMKKLKGHRHIVTYIDSHASQLKGGGFEVFLLMEYCQGSGLIDFMNTRLQHRLMEPEILKIFSDVAEGVAAMHYLVPPLLHRDLKVENVLISHTNPGAGPPGPNANSGRIYKLGDFGSAAPPRPAATTAAEGRLIEDDVQRHTTLQYRSPEMIDVYRKQPIDEKSDVWALGVLLYKLCYYTTPFEEQGQMAILNASFKYPHYPPFSDRLKKLIGSMLRENPNSRPNIYQIVKEVCSMRGADVPIKDIYARRSQSEARRYQELPPPSPTTSSPPAIGLTKAAPTQVVQEIPDITPMRRGRPAAPGQNTVVGHTPSPMRGATSDPFAALDSTDPAVRAAAADELAGKFPSLDEFSLLHDKGTKFEFGAAAPAATPAASTNNDHFQKRVTQALADDAFAMPSKATTSASVSKVPSRSSELPSKVANVARMQSLEKEKDPPSQPVRPQQQERLPQTHITMVSTGVGSSPPPSPRLSGVRQPDFKNRPIWRVPTASASSPSSRDASMTRPSGDVNRPAMPDLHRSKSSTITMSSHALDAQKSPTSSRPSLEGQRPSMVDLTGSGNESLARTRSANARAGQRPASIYVDKNIDHMRDRESGRLSAGIQFTSPSVQQTPRATERFEQATAESSDDEAPEDLAHKDTIRSDVEYLRALEDEEKEAHYNYGPGSSMKMFMGGKKDRRSSSGGSKHGHKSRGSLSGALSGTKEIFRGKFGDAFKKFESGQAGERDDGLLDEPPVSPGPEEQELPPRKGMFGRRSGSMDGTARKSLEQQRRSIDRSRGRSSGEYESERDAERGRKVLTPIAGSEAPSSGPRSDFVEDDRDREVVNADFMEEEQLSPEMRRELERQRLEREEKRVEEAKEAHRLRAAGGGGGENKASAIQNRVMSLLSEAEGDRRDPPKTTAEGYSNFTQETREPRSGGSLPKQRAPPVARKPVSASIAGQMASPNSSSNSLNSSFAQTRQSQLSTASPPAVSASAPPAGPNPRQNLPLAATSTRAQSSPFQPSSSGAQQTTIVVGSGPRPYAPPKPKTLRTGPQRTGGRGGPSLDALLQKDLEGVAEMPNQSQPQARLDADAAQRWGARQEARSPGVGNAGGSVEAGDGDPEWEANFSKKYPSLSPGGIEMVEKEIPFQQGVGKIRDV